ncbi:MAG: hypothetical protein M3Q81_04630 [bacterium]|nr:hypothetical protein [bacterium]
MTLSQLRQQHPRLVYQEATWKCTSAGLQLDFTFLLEPDLVFTPTLVLPDVTEAHIEALDARVLDTLVFQVGMAELFSYWKTACPPEIVIAAGDLTADQVDFWQNLLIQGMGEFFFTNEIDFTAAEFVKWVTVSPKNTLPQTINEPIFGSELPRSIFIPLGGGKDSIVTLKLLQQLQDSLGLSQLQLATLNLNPTLAAKEVAQSSLLPNVTLHRHIDPLLLELNQQGYLNGHTPFSALMAFISVLAAWVYGYEAIAVSNEQSSNEGNVIFHGHEINHQYSKSYDFETKFQRYISHISPQLPYYFSFVRPLYELEIAGLFAAVTQETPELQLTFRSCNRGSKANLWCGECSKCLFAALILTPSLGSARVTEMFGQDILDNESLLPIALELLGKAKQKPLDCVGTHEESVVATWLCLQKYRSENKDLPALLRLLDDSVLKQEAQLPQRAIAILEFWSDQHSLPDTLTKYLRHQLESTKSLYQYI